MKKYVIIPYYVISKADGDEHFISAHQLIDLYKVDPADCEILSDPLMQNHYRFHPDQIILRPKYNGDYSLPTEK